MKIEVLTVYAMPLEKGKPNQIPTQLQKLPPWTGFKPTIFGVLGYQPQLATNL